MISSDPTIDLLLHPFFFRGRFEYCCRHLSLLSSNIQVDVGMDEPKDGRGGSSVMMAVEEEDNAVMEEGKKDEVYEVSSI